MDDHTDHIEELKRYYAVWQETNHIYEEWAKRHGISACCLLMLISIDEGGKQCTQKNISQRWSIPKQTVNMILKDLQNKKYVELIPVQEDKRNKQIQFTVTGKEYADTILSELRKAELTVVEIMGMERIHRLNEESELFIKLFRETGGSPACEDTNP